MPWHASFPTAPFCVLTQCSPRGWGLSNGSPAQAAEVPCEGIVVYNGPHV